LPDTPQALDFAGFQQGGDDRLLGGLERHETVNRVPEDHGGGVYSRMGSRAPSFVGIRALARG
jgi:hypothetical protein